MQTIGQQLMISFKMNGFKLIHQARQLKYKLKETKLSRLLIKEDNSKLRSWERSL
jgi:hypothetical protein